MARQQSIIASLDQLNRIERVDFDRLPATELLAEYRDLYREMTRLRRNRAFAATDLMHQADRERAATERRVMTMANAVHRRSRAVSIDLHEARDRGPEAVLEALELAIARHKELNAREPEVASPPHSSQRKLWIAAAAASTVAIVIALIVRLA
jgi:hypothetical protein